MKKATTREYAHQGTTSLGQWAKAGARHDTVWAAPGFGDGRLVLAGSRNGLTSALRGFLHGIWMMSGTWQTVSSV
jgi:hypothetical protein